MRLDTAFRLSFYVTLALACACLVQADLYFLPLLAYATPLLVGAFVLAWRKEGVWEINETAANYLGLLIALGGAGWVVFQLPRSEDELLLTMAWPAGMLPFLGPLILVLLVIKLFRPKRLADFWVLQTIGLMTVTLGCVLAGEVAFGLLLVGYVAALLWCLALFHLACARRPGSGEAPGRAPLFVPADQASGDVPWRLLGAGRVLGWLTAVLPAGLALFILTPRSGDSQWVPQRLTTTPARVIAASMDSTFDMNRTGYVELGHEPAFRVRVTDRDDRVAAVPAEQYWQAAVLDCYLRGRWISWGDAQKYFHDAGPEQNRPRNIVRAAKTPDGTATLRLRFAVRPLTAGGLVLAEPVEPRGVGDDAEIGGTRPADFAIFSELPGCDVVVGNQASRKGVHKYTQWLDPADDPGRVPARRTDAEYLDYVTAQTVPGPVRGWTRGLLRTVKGLRPEERVLDNDDRVPAPHRAAVARALCAHLARSPEFGYSLYLRRHDRDLDPTADFLLNVKRGHCERFAGGLALMLRGVGIPSRVVRGFHGAEIETPGTYLVRQSQGHAWVQALVHENGRPYWILLDPTPGAEPDEGSIRSWVTWASTLDAGQLWKALVLNYNAETQTGSVRTLWQRVTDVEKLPPLAWGGAGLVAALVLAGGLWRFRGGLAGLWPLLGRRPHAPDTLDVYARLLALLDRHLALRPAVGQTPLEFAHAAAAALRAPAAACADLPPRIADALYRVRFGGQSLPADEHAALDAQLLALQAALTHGRL
jgi:hypothetical protein